MLVYALWRVLLCAWKGNTIYSGANSYSVNYPFDHIINDDEGDYLFTNEILEMLIEIYPKCNFKHKIKKVFH